MSRRIFCKIALVAVVVCGLLAFCGVLFAQGRSDDALARAMGIQKKYNAALMAKAGVVGTGVGSGQGVQPTVLVLLEYGGVPGIPDSLEGVPVRPLVTGKIYAMAPPDNPGQGHKGGGGKTLKPSDRWPRPVPIGVSTGNENECTAGTIGCRVSHGGNVYALSNNHVYARENDATDGEDQVMQPGLYDTHCMYDSDNVIGTLSDFVELTFYDTTNPPDPIPTNTVDAAIAITTTDDVNNATPSDGYGIPSSTTVTDPVDALDGNVQKYGRTSGLTKGTVYAINVTMDVDYGSAGTARFEGQIGVYSSKGPFLRAGDSGSVLVTDPDKEPVGLLFASDPSGHYALANPIGDVLGAFGVDIDGE